MFGLIYANLRYARGVNLHQDALVLFLDSLKMTLALSHIENLGLL